MKTSFRRSSKMKKCLHGRAGPRSQALMIDSILQDGNEMGFFWTHFYIHKREEIILLLKHFLRNARETSPFQRDEGQARSDRRGLRGKWQLLQCVY